MNDKERRVKDDVAGLFDRAAPTYGRIGPRFFTHFGRRLVELAQIPAESDVLDVATGRGAILFPAAKQVGPRGRILGIDLSAEMVHQTTAEIKNAGLKNAEIQQMDAEKLTFPDASFDCVLCGLSIFFFPQCQHALKEMYRVLRSGGRIGLTTFSKNSEHFDWVKELFRSYQTAQGRQVSIKKEEASSLELGLPAGLEVALIDAGFDDIRVIEEEADFVYENEEVLWKSLWSHAGRSYLEKMEPSALERVKLDVAQRVQVFKGPDGICPPPFRVLFTLANKPHH